MPMQDIELTVKNYRCFDRAKPVQFSISPGFTAFVGPNNAGKSALLRLFYEFRQVWNQFNLGNGGVLAMVRGHGHHIPPYGIPDHKAAFCNKNDGPIEITITNPPKGSSLHLICDRNLTWNAKSPLLNGYDQNILSQLEWDHKGNQFIGIGGTNVLPMQDILASMKILSKSIYMGPYRNAINTGAGSYFDLQVGEGFIKTWHEWKAGTDTLHNQRTEQVTEDIRSLFGFSKLEINASADTKTLQIRIDGRPYRLDEIGAGIAQFIIVYANAAISNPSLILIDEPELHLHPRMQERFLTSLAKYASAGVLFATHSLGLAREVADKIYCVQKDSPGVTVKPFESHPTLPELLGELSFSTAREAGVNKLLLVEGGTDVKTYMQWLRKLGKDNVVLALSLGGADRIHGNCELELAEMHRISPQIWAIIDSERTRSDAVLEPSRVDFLSVCEKLGIQALATTRRATENYLTTSAVVSAFGTGTKALTEFEKLSGASGHWKKRENWRAAAEMTVDEILATDVGQFLAKI